MDAVAGLLDGPRARAAFLLRSNLDPPWSLRIQDEAPLTVMAVVRGDAWVLHDDAQMVSVGPGDVAIIRGPDHYTVADDPATPPQVAIDADQVCRSLDAGGAELVESLSLGVRTWGNAADGATVLLTGTYHLHGEVSRRLLRALPRLLVLRDDEWDCPVIPLLADEIVKDEPGQEAVLDRLLDLLLIAVLRAWFARPEAQAPDWYRASSDPVVGRALRLLHHNPAHPWTVAELARESAVSRAALAAASKSSSANRRCPSSPAGASHSPPTCCSNPVPRSAPSPTRSATAAPSRSAPPSSASAASARSSTAPPQRRGRGWAKPVDGAPAGQRRTRTTTRRDAPAA
jgi:hypothetical protein